MKRDKNEDVDQAKSTWCLSLVTWLYMYWYVAILKHRKPKHKWTYKVNIFEVVAVQQVNSYSIFSNFYTTESLKFLLNVKFLINFYNYDPVIWHFQTLEKFNKPKYLENKYFHIILILHF